MGDDDWDAPLNAPRENETRSNLIINYLPQAMSDEDFFSLFVTCGPIANAKIARDPHTGYSFGYGFVDFERPEDAANAIATFNGYGIQNKSLKVSYSRPKGDHIRDTNLFICNLASDVTDDMLHEVFVPYGHIITMNILKDRATGRPKGTAFVRFAKKEEAQAAISGLNGRACMPNSDEPIEVRIAEEHGKQKAAIFSAVVGEFGGLGVSSHRGFHRGGSGAGGYGYGRGGSGGNFYQQTDGFRGGRSQNRFNPIGGDRGGRSFPRGRGFSRPFGGYRREAYGAEEEYDGNGGGFYN